VAGAIPRTPATGQIQRARLRELLLTGTAPGDTGPDWRP
jgi:hypothetical protein